MLILIAAPLLWQQFLLYLRHFLPDPHHFYNN